MPRPMLPQRGTGDAGVDGADADPDNYATSAVC
jgi:hypothetical protein